MAKLTTLFDASKVKPNQRPTPVPAGKYPVQITSSEMKPVAGAGNKGSYLELVFEIISGEYKGQHLWERLNLVNASAKAVEIAKGTLSAICHATGVMQINDSVLLHNKPMQASVVLTPAVIDEKGAEKYPVKNEISGYEPLEGTAASGGAPAWAAAKPEASATVAVKKAPPGKKPAPEPAAAVAPDNRVFYVQIGDETPEHTGDQVAAMLAQGMPADTPVCMEGDADWKTPADYGIGAPAVPAPAALAEVKSKLPPWARK